MNKIKLTLYGVFTILSPRNISPAVRANVIIH